MKKLFARLTKTFKLSASDPSNFEEKWGFRTTPIQLFSFILISIIILSFLLSFLFFKTGAFDFLGAGGNSIHRTELENQEEKIILLNTKLQQQEIYLENVRDVLLGNITSDSLQKTIPNIEDIDLSKIKTGLTKNELAVSEKVLNDIRTQTPAESSHKIAFIAPAKGTISQKYSAKTHPGIDIVLKSGSTFQSAFNGVVLYAGFTQNDGNMLIIWHPENFVTIYKHAQILFKSQGDRVQTGDLLGLSGDTGENSSGPHLHFEIWKNQMALNPEEVLNF